MTKIRIILSCLLFSIFINSTTMANQNTSLCLGEFTLTAGKVIASRNALNDQLSGKPQKDVRNKYIIASALGICRDMLRVYRIGFNNLEYASMIAIATSLLTNTIDIINHSKSKTSEQLLPPNSAIPSHDCSAIKAYQLLGLVASGLEFIAEQNNFKNFVPSIHNMQAISETLEKYKLSSYMQHQGDKSLYKRTLLSLAAINGLSGIVNAYQQLTPQKPIKKPNDPVVNDAAHKIFSPRTTKTHKTQEQQTDVELLEPQRPSAPIIDNATHKNYTPKTTNAPKAQRQQTHDQPKKPQRPATPKPATEKNQAPPPMHSSNKFDDSEIESFWDRHCPQNRHPCDQRANPCLESINPCSLTVNPCLQQINPCHQTRNPCDEVMPILRRGVALTSEQPTWLQPPSMVRQQEPEPVRDIQHLFNEVARIERSQKERDAIEKAMRDRDEARYAAAAKATSQQEPPANFATQAYQNVASFAQKIVGAVSSTIRPKVAPISGTPVDQVSQAKSAPNTWSLLHEEYVTLSRQPIDDEEDRDTGRYMMRMIAIDDVQENPKIILDYSHNFDEQVRTQNEFADLFRNCHGSVFDKQIHQELCHTITTMANLVNTNPLNPYPESIAPAVYHFSAIAQEEKNPEIKAALADACYFMTKAMQGTVNLVQSSARVVGMAAEHIIEHKKQFVQGMLSCPLSTLHKEYIQPLTMAGQMLDKAIHLACSDPIRLASGVAQLGMQAWAAEQKNPEECAALLLEMFATQRISQVMNVEKFARALSQEIAVVRSTVKKVDEAKQAIVKPMQKVMEKAAEKFIVLPKRHIKTL